jgi:hypothetical protein
MIKAEAIKAIDRLIKLYKKELSSTYEERIGYLQGVIQGLYIVKYDIIVRLDDDSDKRGKDEQN